MASFHGFPLLPPTTVEGLSIPEALCVPPSIYLRNDEEAARAALLFRDAKIIGLDTETTGLHWSMGDVPLFVSMARFSGSLSEKRAPLDRTPDGVRIAFPIRLLRHFRHILEDATVAKVLTNPKFDMHQLAVGSGIRVAGTILDTQYLSFLYDENIYQHGLKPTAQRYLQIKMRKFDFKNMKPFFDILEMHDRDGRVAEAERLAHVLYLSMRETELLVQAKAAKVTSEFDRQHPMYTAKNPTQAADDARGGLGDDTAEEADADDEDDDGVQSPLVQAIIQGWSASGSPGGSDAQPPARAQMGLGFERTRGTLLDAEGNAVIASDTLVARAFARTARGDEAEIDELSCLRFLLKHSRNVDLGVVTPAETLRQFGRKLGLTPRFTGEGCGVAEILYIHSVGQVALQTVAERTPERRLEAADPAVLRRVALIVYEAALAYHRRKFLPGTAVDEVRREIQEYASLDAWASLALGRYFIRALSDPAQAEVTPGCGVPYRTLWGQMQSRSAKMTKVLWAMEGRGVCFDRDRAADMEKALGEQVKAAHTQLDRAMAERLGRPGNLNSVVDLRKFLFDFDPETGLWYDLDGDVIEPGPRMKATGPATNKSVLKELEEKGNVNANLIMQFRALTKLISTYVGALPKYISPMTGRIHTSFRQHAAVTGRLSSTSPALLNIPTRGDNGRLIRASFRSGTWGDVRMRRLYCLDAVAHVPLPDLPPETPMRLAVGDYSAAELVTLAYLSKDENMIRAIQMGRDLHCTTVAYAYPGQYAYEDVLAAHKAKKDGASPEIKKLKSLRDRMKTAIFGVIYGIGPVSLARQLGLRVVRVVDPKTGRMRETSPEAEEVMERLFTAYPRVKDWIESTKATVRKVGYVTTISGRRRRLPDAKSKIHGLRARAERQGPNARIQGSVFDMIQDAMIRIEEDPELRSLGVQLLLQVHDELLAEYPDLPGYKERVLKRLGELMSGHVFGMNVAPVAEFEDGDNWAAAKG